MVWLHMRNKKHESDNRTGIVLATLEKNPNIDLEELMHKITPKSATLKENLLKKLMWGSVSLLSVLVFWVMPYIWTS